MDNAMHCELCKREKPESEMNRFSIIIDLAATKERSGRLILYICTECQIILNKHIERAYAGARQEITADMLWEEKRKKK